MKVPVYIERIFCLLLCTLGEFLNAKQINDQWYSPEDEFLPRKRRKLSVLFLFLPKKKLVRWHAYWMHRMTQIYFLAYFVIMVVWRCISGSFDFLTSTVFALYPLLMILSDVFLRIGVFVYAKIKKAKQQKSREE